ncbi:tyrosine-protein phosphatase [Sphingobacterium pedocola]|uniref:protein-tyrosine-phosphatase n=1 Tax=Sphingobacterium pedocola TaxID=2082722 RepID=A0ABR9T1V9_9SPHI|nr:CpsB/CapC family capsule biosynthesis tyrosine phosphatase [Sphingobacterium pedocola]MBE8719318.1 histidinol phosphatase [Sphingobacterium pedocola]
MFSIFNRTRQYTDLRWIQVDMHSHILPGLDDGCQELAQSLMLLDRLHAVGLSEFHFTPHIFRELYPNSPATIAPAFEQVQSARSAAIKVGYAAEYMVDSAFDQLLLDPDVELLTLPGKHILIEMSYMQESKQIEKTVFDLQIAGYKPILAHPERYIFYHQQPERIKHLRDMGCLLQVNLLSVYGYYGLNEKRMAKYLIDKGWIDLIGTDVHHERHVRAIEQGLKKEDISTYFKKCNIQNERLFSNN